MNDLVEIVVPGAPIAKGRGRATKAGVVYTPRRTRDYEALGKLAARQAWGDRPPHAGPVEIRVVAAITPPASWSAAKKMAALRGEIRPTSRPDGDNYLKSAQDIMNGIVLCDDAQVVRAVIEKAYAAIPELAILVRCVDAKPSNGKIKL